MPVGPVHAGVIEPGHFRFSTAGEPILNLEVRLGYVHRGVEKGWKAALRTARCAWSKGFPGTRSGARPGLLPGLGGEQPGAERAQLLRCIYAEMERIYNHLGDIGGMATDVAFAVPAAEAAMLRERMLRLNVKLTGHRLLWGSVAIGGAARDLDDDKKDLLEGAMVDLGLAFEPLVDSLKTSPSFLDRVETTGTLTLPMAKDLGRQGAVARASGWTGTPGGTSPTAPTDGWASWCRCVGRGTCWPD